MRLLIKLTICLTLVVAAASTTATAAGMSGAVLTKPEYQQLVAIGKSVKSASSGRHGAAKAALRVCRRASGASALLRASKAKCEALVYFELADLNIVSTDRGCSKLKTADQVFACLTPSFSALSADSEALVLAIRRVDRAANARRLESSCVAVLGAPKKGLALLVSFAGDVRVLVASMRADNVGLFNVAIKRVGSLDGAFKAVPPASISVCPHQ